MEKYLKAFLLFHDKEIPFVHSINYLIKECTKIDKDFDYLFKINAGRLTKYYTRTRYLPILEVRKEEAENAVEIAKKVEKFILNKFYCE